MATTVGNLVVKLTAATGPFVKGIKTAGNSVSRLAKAIGRATVRVAKYSAALVAAAAAGLSLFVRRQMAAIDSTAKFADRLGILTERLVGLEHAAGQTGVPVSALRMGLQRMTRRVAEAAKGLGEARGALKDLGLDAERLAGMSPDQQFRAIADAMQGVESQSERVRLAFKLFDSEGVALINTLRGGSEALDAYQREAEKLGITFNEVDGNKVEAANDALDNLGKLITGAARRLTVQLAPFITAAANRLIDMGTAGTTMGERVTAAVQLVAEGVAKVSSVVDLVTAGWHTLNAGVQVAAAGILKSIKEILGGLDMLVEAVTGATSRMGEMADLMADDLWRQSQESADKARKAFDDFTTGARVGRVRDFFSKIREDAERMAEASERTGEGLGGLEIPESNTDAISEQPALPRLLRAGTAEAISFINRQRANERSGMDKLQRTNEQQLAEHRITNTLLRQQTQAGMDEPVLSF